jgi:hypothetical protein
MKVLSRLWPEGTVEMSHDISCTVRDPNRAPAVAFRSVTFGAIVPGEKETVLLPLHVNKILSHK